MTKIEKIREAIFQVFGEDYASARLRGDDFDEFMGGLLRAENKVREMMAEDIFTGRDDPGQWSPMAVAVIHCENGLDSGYYNQFAQERWTEVEERLPGYYVESINAAVLGLYKI